MSDRPRISGIDDESYRPPVNPYPPEPPRWSESWPGVPPQRERRGLTWLYYIPLAILILAIIGGIWWYVQDRKEAANGASRLSGLGDLEEANVRKMLPDTVPDDKDLAAAISLFKRGFLKPAQAAFAAIVESGKDPVIKSMALSYLGIMADDEGKFNLAVDFFRRALRFDPKNFYAHYNLAIALRHKGMYKEALAELEIARELRPDLIEPETLKGQLLYQSQDYAGAEKVLGAAADRYNDPMAHYDLGLTYKKQGKFAEAKTSFLAALDTAGAGEIAYKAASQLGVIAATQGDLPNAEYYMQRAVELSPADAKYLYNLALIQYRMGKGEEALRNLEKTTRLGHENPETFAYIARLYTELGQPERAETALKKALELAPYDATLLSALADLQIARSRWGDAAATLKRLYDTATSTQAKAQALYNLGRVYTEIKDWSAAMNALEKARDLDPTNEDALITLADVYVNRGEAHKAVAVYKEALRLNPDNVKLMRATATMYLDLGLLAEADDMLRRLNASPIKTVADEDFSNLTLGEISRRRKAFDTALDYFGKALNSSDSRVKFDANLAYAETTLEAERPSSGALDKVRKALAIDPASEPARLVLSRALLREGTIGSREMAEEELTALIRVAQNATILSRAHTLRGIIYYKGSLYSKALDDFNRALDLDPGNREAFENRRATAARMEGSY